MDYRKFLIDYVLNSTPRIFSLLDRNPYSLSYGCFDREFHHYKSKNFMNGLMQSYIMSLSLLYNTLFENNSYYNNYNLKNLIISCIKFTIASSHKDGSYDEHFLNEHSDFATSMVLFSLTESIIILKLDYQKYSNGLEKIANFLMSNEEKYVRSNHLACKILALYNLYYLSGHQAYISAVNELKKKLLSNRSEEGWFYEYKGCDLGYLTFTLYFLAKFTLRTKDKLFDKIIQDSIKFCTHFMHPDGSFGGFYGSRNTSHFLPLSFEYFDTIDSKGKKMVNLFLKGLSNGNAEDLSDHRYNFLMYNNIIEILDHFNENRITSTLQMEDFLILFEEAGIYVFKKKEYYGVLAIKKGGVFYLFKNSKLIFRNCGICAKTSKGFVSSTGFDGVKYSISNNKYVIQGCFKKYYPKRYLGKIQFVLFNLYNLFLGKYAVFRKFLKKKLIKGLILNEKEIRASYIITINIQDKIVMSIEIKSSKNVKFYDLIISNYFSPIFIPSANFFQKSELFLNEIILNEKLEKLNNNKNVTIELKF